MFMIAGLFIPTTTAVYVGEPVQQQDPVELVYHYAEIFGVQPDLMLQVINCENPEWIPALQSRIIQRDGTREDSWGLAQIHLPSHPTITKEQAQDPAFAIRFLADNLSKGNGNMWTCYRMLSRSGSG